MAKISERYVVDEHGKKTDVILPVKKFRELLEDLHDLAVVAERRNDPTVNFNELKKRLKSDGLL